MNLVISNLVHCRRTRIFLAAEVYYTGLESDLQQQLGNIESAYPGYDEYRYDLAEIGHDPFELISYLTALYEDFTIAEVRQPLNALFNRQYKLTVTETVETRYQTEIRTDTWTETDPETGATTAYSDTYTVEVPYDYHILNVQID